MTPIYKYINVFSKQELKLLNEVIINSDSIIDTNLGRLKKHPVLPENIINTVLNIANNISNDELGFSSLVYVKYNNIYGSPNLPPHFDGDSNDLVIDFQLSSNTSWDLGVNLKTYNLQDNSALVFNANENIHWRPFKDFKDGEYIDMLFFRFYNKVNKSDYSYLRFHPDHDIFKEVRELRASSIVQQNHY